MRSRSRAATSPFASSGSSSTSPPGQTSHDRVAVALEAGVGARDVVRDDQVAALARELAARRLDHVVALGREAHDDARARARR